MFFADFSGSYQHKKKLFSSVYKGRTLSIAIYFMTNGVNFEKKYVSSSRDFKGYRGSVEK